MKTDAIENLISKHLEQTEDSPVAREAEAELAALEAKLREWEEREAGCCPEDRGFEEVIAWQSKRIATLEADNAAMREVLQRVSETIDVDDDNVGVINEVDSLLLALTPDSGKVLVDLDMLRKIDFALAACPVCQAGRDKAPGGIWEHSSDCEFSALLKDRP